MRLSESDGWTSYKRYLWGWGAQCPVGLLHRTGKGFFDHTQFLLVCHVTMHPLGTAQHHSLWHLYDIVNWYLNLTVRLLVLQYYVMFGCGPLTRRQNSTFSKLWNRNCGVDRWPPSRTWRDVLVWPARRVCGPSPSGVGHFWMKHFLQLHLRFSAQDAHAFFCFEIAGVQ